MSTLRLPKKRVPASPKNGTSCVGQKRIFLSRLIFMTEIPDKEQGRNRDGTLILIFLIIRWNCTVNLVY